MIYFSLVFLIVTSYLCGTLVQRFTKEKELLLPETCILGVMVMLLFWEVFMMIGIKLLLSFAWLCKLYSGLLLILIILTLALEMKNIKERLKIRTLQSLWPYVGTFGICGIQVLVICLMMPDTTRDFTVEMVNTTLVSDLVYEHHPEMGSVFQYGITFRGKLVTLPLFYAYLLQLFGGATTTLVYRCIPVWGLVLNGAVYWLLGYCLFGETKKVGYRPMVFVMGVGILNLFGSFAKNCAFYYLIYCGFRGEAFIYGVFLPYSLWICYQIFVQKKYKYILYLGMTLCTSLCITDYQKGFLPILLSVILCGILSLSAQIGRWIRCRQ